VAALTAPSDSAKPPQATVANTTMPIKLNRPPVRCTKGSHMTEVVYDQVRRIGSGTKLLLGGRAKFRGERIPLNLKLHLIFLR
jgi:hypothetical protein